MGSFVWAAVAAMAVLFAVPLVAGGPPPLLPAAAILCVLLGVGHSVLGERYLIGPILSMDGLPRILGDVAQTRTVLRFAWHLTTLLWWGIAAVLAYMAAVPAAISRPLLWMIVSVFGASGAIALVGTRGAHKSWVYFFAIAGLAGLAIGRG